MNAKTLIAIVALTLSASPVMAGCSSDGGGGGAVEGDEQDVVVASDTAIKKELTAAIAGLETSGGEGDADPYKLTDVKLRRGETMTDDVLLKRLLPKLTGVARTDDSIPGLDETPIADAWKSYTADPDPADFEGDPDGLEHEKQQVAKWKNVQQLVEAKLTNVKYFDMGYRSSPEGSIETGAVAHVIVGQTSTGRVIAIWGIDIWT